LFGREILLFPGVAGATLIGLEDFFQQEEDGTKSLRNVRAYLPNYTASTLKRNNSYDLENFNNTILKSMLCLRNKIY
jgi:hypothetical protein